MNTKMKFPEQLNMEICQALYKNGESIKSIAEKTNKSEDVIINYLKLLGIYSEDLEKRDDWRKHKWE